MAAAEYHTIDLGRLHLKAGEARRMDVALADDQLRLGGQDYALHHEGPARLDISRTLSGYALRLRLRGSLDGPCVRCLNDAHAEVAVDAREVEQPSEDDEELLSPYVDVEELDVNAWAHDALVLALPPAILCRSDCKGLCPVCGIPLNDAEPGHSHEPEPDPRWAKLRELKLDQGE